MVFFERLVQREPWKNEWRFLLARARICCKQYREAALELQAALQRNPRDCRALVCLAELFERNGFYGRAVKLLRKVLAIFPRHPRCRSFLGDCLVKNKEFEVQTNKQKPSFFLL